MKILTENAAEKMLSKFLPVARSILAKKEEDAAKFAKKIKYPVVLKIISPQALHKTEVSGVRIVKNEAELKSEFNSLSSLSKKRKLKLEGILVQEFVKGTELIIGIKKDATFGHVILFGIGGVFVEVLKDISFRVCPITANDAEQMIDELKAKALLFGVRGQKPVNLKLLKEILVKASKLPERYPKITEMDINPFMLNDKLGKVADARIVLE
jgi:acyl-CoA synthetase (NDP forming)